MSTKPRPKKKRRRYLTDKGVSRLSPDKRKPFIVTDEGARGLGIKITPARASAKTGDDARGKT